MAGYNYSLIGDDNIEFHIGDPNLRESILKANGHRRVLILQLDGDEMEAALWGLENYKKEHGDAP